MDPQRSSEKACASRASINATSLDDIRSPGSTPVVNIRHEDSEPWKSRELCLSQRLFHNQKLNRVLERPQITGIAFSGTVGIGIFVMSGQLIGISGSLGYVIASIVAALIMTGVMRSLAEMVSVRPISGGLMDFPHTFIDPALGFAVGVTYWLSQCLSMAAITAFAAQTANSFSDGGGIGKKALIMIIVGSCIFTLLSNLCGVRIYGNLGRVVKWFKFFIFFILWLLMILVKAGVGDTQVESPIGSNGTAHEFKPRTENGYGNNSFTPYFRWNGFNGPADLADGGYKTGIPGSWGQFLAIWTCIIFAMSSYIGGDIVIVTAGEAKFPRRDLPAVAQFMYLAPISFYVISAFLVGLNINFMNPDLQHPWDKPISDASATSFSPFIIVLKQTTIKVLPKFLNGCFLLSIYTVANTSLYVSSRTLYAVVQIYGNSYMRAMFGRTNNSNIPVTAILFCALFGFLALLGLADKSFNEPIQVLYSFFTGSIGCVYAAECAAFLRFRSGLRHSGLCRDDSTYKKRHYRGHWQPAWAIFGLFGCTMVVVFSGWPSIYLLKERDMLSTANLIKGTGPLVGGVVGAYSGPLLFIILYFGYKTLFRTRLRHFRDYELSYFLPEFDDEPAPWRLKDYNGPRWRYILSEIWSFVK